MRIRCTEGTHTPVLSTKMLHPSSSLPPLPLSLLSLPHSLLALSQVSVCTRSMVISLFDPLIYSLYLTSILIMGSVWIYRSMRIWKTTTMCVSKLLYFIHHIEVSYCMLYSFRSNYPKSGNHKWILIFVKWEEPSSHACLYIFVNSSIEGRSFLCLSLLSFLSLSRRCL